MARFIFFEMVRAKLQNIKIKHSSLDPNMPYMDSKIKVFLIHQFQSFFAKKNKIIK